jgi:recombination protein RecT
MNQQVTQAPAASAKPSLPGSNGTPRHDIAVQMQSMRPQFAAALPAHIPVEKFERVVLTALALNSDLLAVDRKSLFLACNKAAQDGLLPDGREGAIVSFAGKAAWLPMIGGIIKRMRQSGELSTLSANVVYENDHFAYVLGDEERIEHKPLLIGDRGKPILCYAIAKLKDGGIQREVMTAADVERARKVSRAPNSLMWKDFWGEGARKTVIKRLAKYLPLSAEDRRTLDRDETEFEAQKRDALLAQAAAQIGAAPQAAIAHQPEAEPPALDGEEALATLNQPEPADDSADTR